MNIDQVQVEVYGLAGRLGEVSLGPGLANAWDLVCQVHSKFSPPCGTFWKLVIENKPITQKDIPITGISEITCVKYAPSVPEQRKAVRAVEGLVCSGRSLDALPLGSHL